jgi:hypothetical protein
MAAPNLLTIATVTAATAVANASTTSANIVTNSAGSSTVVKINSLVVANANTLGSTVAFTAGISRTSGNYPVSSGIAVPANASLIAISKDANIYLVEGDGLYLIAGSNTSLQAICSYEILAT